MLEGLDHIDWSQYNHAYGVATDVPDLIRKLLVPDEVEETLSTLFSTIWHQGTVYASTAVAVPFLIKVLEADCNAGILYLLSSCGTGYGYYEVHGDGDFYRDRRGTPEFQETIREELKNVQAAHDAVMKGLPVYLRCLGHEDPEVRQAAGEVISICYERTSEASEALRNQIRVETDEAVLLSLARRLGILLSRERSRYPETPLEPADNDLFVAWMRTFPAAVGAVLAKFLVIYGTETGRDAGLAFINAIPENPPVQIGWSVNEIMQALCHHDLDLAVDWLVRMSDYGESETLSQIPGAAAHLYCRYRLDYQPLFGIVEKLLFHANPRVVEDSTFALSVFGQYTLSLKSRLASRTIQRIEQARTFFKTLADWLSHDVPSDLSTGEILDFLENPASPYQLSHLFSALGEKGSAALTDSRTLPVLMNAIEDHDQWIRVCAARALALIAPHAHPDRLKTVLIDEIRGRPVGLIAIDTITYLARHGMDMKEALPRLQIIANSPMRQFSGIDETVVDDDIQLQAIAHRAIEAITQ